MFSIPNLAWARTTSTYSQLFVYTALWNIGLLGLLLAGLFLLCLVLKVYLLKQHENKLLTESIITLEERDSTVRISQRQPHSQSQLQLPPPVQVHNPDTLVFRSINFLTSLFFYTLCLLISSMYLVLYSFGNFGRGTSIDVLSVFVMTLLVAFPTLIWKYKTKIRDFRHLRTEIAVTTVFLVVWLALCVFLVLACSGACVCLFTDKYGFKVQEEFRISTSWSRQFIGKICPEQTVCHVYATLPEDSATSVFINIHTGMSLSRVFVLLSEIGGSRSAQADSNEPIPLTNVDSIAERYVHSVLLTGLKAGTTYALTITDANKSVLYSSKYRTVPDRNGSVLRLAMGGDVGMTAEGEKLTSSLVAYDPDAIILGGDTVYDDGMRTCYFSWDTFYQMFGTVTVSLGRIVPLILTIGNHDVGFDALATPRVSKQLVDIPLFFLFNPQHLSPRGFAVPTLPERSSIHHHRLGPTVHFSLDSGYLQQHLQQTDYLRLKAGLYSGYHKFANYHNPLYPSCSDPTPDSNDDLVIRNGSMYWIPIFDQLKFVAAMEHHTHFRKITHRIRNGQRNDTGMRFVGDGSWGVKQEVCPDSKALLHPELFLDYANDKPNHVWLVTLTRTPVGHTINYTSVDLEGIARTTIDLLPFQFNTVTP